MNLEDLINNITPEIHTNLKRAVELGKWPDGGRLSQEQKEQSLQAIIAYEAKHLPEEERIGYIEPNSCGSSKKSKTKPKENADAISKDDEAKPLNWQDS